MAISRKHQDGAVLCHSVFAIMNFVRRSLRLDFNTVGSWGCTGTVLNLSLATCYHFETPIQNVIEIRLGVAAMRHNVIMEFYLL